MVKGFIIINQLVKNMKGSGKMIFGMEKEHILLESPHKLLLKVRGSVVYSTDKLKFIIEIKTNLKDFLKMVKNKEEAKYFMLMELILKDNSKMTNFVAKVKLYINMNRVNAHIKANSKMESKVEKV